MPDCNCNNCKKNKLTSKCSNTSRHSSGYSTCSSGYSSEFSIDDDFHRYRNYNKCLKKCIPKKCEKCIKCEKCEKEENTIVCNKPLEIINEIIEKPKCKEPEKNNGNCIFITIY